MRSALQGTDADAVRRAMGALSESMQKIGQAVYAGAGAGGPGPDGASAGPERPRDEGAVEGEFREV